MTKEKADNLADSIRQCIRVSLNTRSFGHTGLISLNECQEIENQAFALLSERIQLAFENVIPEEPTVYGTHKTRG